MIKFIQKYRSGLSYLFFSGMTAVIEAIIGLLCIHFLGFSDVPANTCGIVIGAVVHYVCVTRVTFRADVNTRTLGVYVGTFFLGMLIQNLVVWGLSVALDGRLEQNIRYLVEKGCSLVVSFTLMYGLRKKYIR